MLRLSGSGSCIHHDNEIQGAKYDVMVCWCLAFNSAEISIHDNFDQLHPRSKHQLWHKNKEMLWTLRHWLYSSGFTHPYVFRLSASQKKSKLNTSTSLRNSDYLSDTNLVQASHWADLNMVDHIYIHYSPDLSSLGDEGWKTLTIGHCFQVFSTIQRKTMARHSCYFSSKALQ